MAIALFYAVATGIGGIAGPALRAHIATGNRTTVFYGYLFGAGLMILGGLVEIWPSASTPSSAGSRTSRAAHGGLLSRIAEQSARPALGRGSVAPRARPPKKPATGVRPVGTDAGPRDVSAGGVPIRHRRETAVTRGLGWGRDES